MSPDLLLANAATVAQEILLPAAAEVDATGRIPAAHLDALAEAGLYGATTSPDLTRIIEILASGCLATTFVWLQHHGLVNRLIHGPQPSFEDGDALTESLRAGTRRAGIVQAGLLPGQPLLTAEKTADGWALNGFSPWCTGWGMINDVLVAARIDAGDGTFDTVVWLVIPAIEQPGLTVEPLHLQAVNATSTVALRFDGLHVGDQWSLGTDPYDQVGHAVGKGLRANGSLALGLVARCDAVLAHLTSESPFLERRDKLRTEMDNADDRDLALLRVDSLRLALSAASAVVAASGAASAIAGSTPERLMREATFLMVFGSRPTIKSGLYESLVASPT